MRQFSKVRFFNITTVKETPSFDRFRGVFTGEELTVHINFRKDSKNPQD